MTMKSIMIVALICAIVTFAIVMKVAAAEPAAVPMEKADMYHLQALLAKSQVAQQQLNNLYIQFINANPDAKKLREELDNLGQQQQALVDALFVTSKLDKSKYQIDVEKGEFKKIDKK